MEKVNHPEHYQSKKGIEVIDAMDAFTEGLEGIEAVDTAQVIKYICRWKKKNGLEDLKKAKWYIDHLISIVSHQEEVTSIESTSTDDETYYNYCEYGEKRPLWKPKMTDTKKELL